MNIDPELFEVLEAPKRKVDPRVQVLHDLRIDTTHPLFVEQRDDFEIFPPEVQCIFFQQLKKDIETYDELKRMSDRDIKMKAKMAEYANKRKKHTKY